MAPKPRRNITKKPSKKPNYGSFTHERFPKVTLNPEKPISKETRDLFRDYFKRNSGFGVSVADRTKHPVVILKEKFQKYGALDKISRILNSNKPLEVKIKDLYMEFSMNLFVREVFDINRLSIEDQYHATQLLLQMLDPSLTLVRKFNPNFKPERNSVGITERNGSENNPKTQETPKESTTDPVITIDGDKATHTYAPTNIGNKKEIIDTRIPREVRPVYDSKEYQGPVTIERQNKEFNDIWGEVLKVISKTQKQSKKTRTQLITEFIKDKVKKVREAGQRLKGRAQEIDLEAFKKFLLENLRHLARTQPHVIDEREIIRDVSNLFPTDYSLKTNERIDINEGNKRIATYPEIEQSGDLKNLPVRLQDSINGEDIRSRIRKHPNPKTDIKSTGELKENTSLERFAKKPKELSREAIELILDYDAHLEYLIEIKKINRKKDKKRLSDFFKRLVERDEIKAREILSKILKNRPDTKGELNTVKEDLAYRTPFEQQKHNYVKRFEMINNIDISQIRTIFQLIQIIRPENILDLAKEINFATRHLRTKLSSEEISDLEELSASFEKFGKVLSKARDNPDKFNESATQELLFWLKRENNIPESYNLESFVDSVLKGKRTTHPENIDLNDWELLNRFADARNMYGIERINYLNRVLGLSNQRLYQSLEQIKKLLEPKEKPKPKKDTKIEPLEPIGEKGTFDELSEALRNGDAKKISEISGLKTPDILEFESVLQSATTLSTKSKRFEYAKDIEDLIKNFDIKTFEKNYNKLMEFLNNNANRSSTFYLDLFELSERSRLILESMRIIAENKSRFIGQDFKKLIEILKDPKKIYDLDFFVWETLRKEPEKPRVKYEAPEKEPTEIRPEEFILVNEKESPVENTESRAPIDERYALELNKFLKSMLRRSYSATIQRFTSDAKRVILSNGETLRINNLDVNVRTTTNGLILDFGNNHTLELFENVNYILTNESLVYKSKGLLWDSAKKHPIPQILKSKEPNIHGAFVYREGKLTAYLP
jgi:hypothetical protein